MNYNLKKYLKLIFILFWNLLTKINFTYFYNNQNINKTILFKTPNLKKIKILLIKPFYYTDLYSPTVQNEIEMVRSTRYRMGPIGLIMNFDTSLIISKYKNEKKINLNEIDLGDNANYCKSQYEKAADLDNFKFNQYDWVISIKDSVPRYIIKKYPNILWTKLFEDHRENSYLKDNYLGSDKYDLTLDTTQGFSPYSYFKHIRSISFPYSFGNSELQKKLNFQNIKNQQLVAEIYQPKNLSFDSLKNLKIFKADGGLKTFDYLELLSKTKYFYCPFYEIPRWGNSIIEAAIFDCLIIGNPNCFWNSLLIQKECIAKNHNEGLKILEKFQNDNVLYADVLKKQRNILNLINFEYPLFKIFKILRKNFPNKKILNSIKLEDDK